MVERNISAFLLYKVRKSEYLIIKKESNVNILCRHWQRVKDRRVQDLALNESALSFQLNESEIFGFIQICLPNNLNKYIAERISKSANSSASMFRLRRKAVLSNIWYIIDLFDDN